jgi:hypothetical protein
MAIPVRPNRTIAGIIESKVIRAMKVAIAPIAIAHIRREVL